jgi:putative transposase
LKGARTVLRGGGAGNSTSLPDYLWRAVDQDGDVLDILVQRHRDKKAAKKFFRKLLKGLRYVPNVIITDKLRSYGSES